MRSLPVLLLLPLLAFQAHAQTTPSHPAAPSASTAATKCVTPDAAGTTTAKHHRMTWKERFAAANVTHDGHLTLEQAKSSDRTVARHFTEIDADKKGYVTEEDVANWQKMERAMHHHARSARAEEGLRPRHAFQQGATPQPMNASTSTQLVPMTQPDAQAAGQQATTK